MEPCASIERTEKKLNFLSVPSYATTTKQNFITRQIEGEKKLLSNFPRIIFFPRSTLANQIISISQSYYRDERLHACMYSETSRNVMMT